MKYTTFESWMEAVNGLVFTHFILEAYDLPDLCYRDWFESGITPMIAARKTIKSCMK
jgi:hypothetical protein